MGEETTDSEETTTGATDGTVADGEGTTGTTEAVWGLRATLREIRLAERRFGRDEGSVRLVAVSKTHSAEVIAPLLSGGHRLFGENRVQEAMGKWPSLRERFSDLELRLIGPLQSNKAGEAVATFDAIESVDREKIARALAREMERRDRRLPVWVQVNTGEEPQKAGVPPRDAVGFVEICREMGHDVRGLMCIPPASENPGPHFALLAKLADEAGLPERSMGMSGDFAEGVRQGATSVRVGSAIFGMRGTAAG